MKLGMTPRASSLDQFSDLLVRSRLMEAADVQALRDRWRRETLADADDVDQFSQWLIAQGNLTEYQVNLLLRGHADHCFLGDYKLLDRIGKGRMAGVYKGVHRLGQIVALKVLPPSRASNPQFLARFRREARMALRLRHPHVVRTFQLADTPDLAYIVMEFLDGETLHDVLRRRGKLPAPEGVRLIHQALLGLQHIHEKHLVHRDLKPANLMLVPQRRPDAPDSTVRSTVKILDIGLGKDLLDDSPDDVNVGVQLTGENTLLGTPDYLAPEQARNARAVDIRADIYSLGCVLYHVVTGQTPFPDTNVFQLIMRHAHEELRPAHELEPSIPTALHDVIRKMTAKDPDHRYDSPAQAAGVLRPFFPAQEMPAPESAPRSEKFTKWIEDQIRADAPTPMPSPRRMATVRPVSAFELSGPIARPVLDREPAESAAASVPTTVVELSPDEQTQLNPSLAQAPARLFDWSRRDVMFLGVGAFSGALLMLAVQFVLWLVMRSQH